MRYLRELVLPHPAMKRILEEYLQGIDAAHARVERIEASMLSLLESWRLKPAVQALVAFRGFQLVAAMITVSELGDIHRFEHPRQLMTYLGLVPTEASSGPRQRLGAISRCGNGHQRWLLVECAEHYALPPKISKELSVRQLGQPQAVPPPAAQRAKARRSAPPRFSSPSKLERPNHTHDIESRHAVKRLGAVANPRATLWDASSEDDSRA